MIEQLGRRRQRCAERRSSCCRAIASRSRPHVARSRTRRPCSSTSISSTDLVGRVPSTNASALRPSCRQGVRDAHTSTRLRQIASNSAAEQRRCLMFRDKWINKPLPHERMRPLLNDISVTTRDQLTAFRDLTNAAATPRRAAEARGRRRPPDAKNGLRSPRAVHAALQTLEAPTTGSRPDHEPGLRIQATLRRHLVLKTLVATRRI